MCLPLRKGLLLFIIFAAFAPLCSFSADMTPNPERLENFGPLVGVWQNKDKSIELVYWFSEYAGRVGFITNNSSNNSCTEEFKISREGFKSQAYYINSDGEQSLTSNVYLGSSEPYSKGFRFDNTNCAEVQNQEPRYSKGYYLAFVENNSRLLISRTRDFRSADILKRADLEKKHANQILITQKINRYTLSKASSSAICLATESYMRTIKMDAAGGSGVTRCPLLANVKKPLLSDYTIEEWRINHNELGELFYYIYTKDYKSARQDILYVMAYIWLMEGYSKKCIKEMPRPVTTINHAWHTEVTTSTGWKYDKNHKTSSYTMPASYAVHYKAAYDHIASNPYRYLNVPNYFWKAESFISERCASQDLNRLLENYAESFN